MKSNNTSNSNQTDSFSNCHKNQQSKMQSPQSAKSSADQDSSTSKYVVENDARERKDGPGGN